MRRKGLVSDGTQLQNDNEQTYWVSNGGYEKAYGYENFVEAGGKHGSFCGCLDWCTREQELVDRSGTKNRFRAHYLQAL
jgi:hypothetical protein